MDDFALASRLLDLLDEHSKTCPQCGGPDDGCDIGAGIEHVALESDPQAYDRRAHARPAYVEGPVVTSPDHLFRLPEMEALRHAEQEHNYAVGLDSKGRVLVVHLAALGTVDKAQAHARDVFRELIRHNCARFLFVHNHPGGNRDPSDTDREVTAWLTKAGEWLGIPLDAHLLVAGDGPAVEVPEPDAAPSCPRCHRPLATSFSSPDGKCFREHCPRDAEAEADCARVEAHRKAGENHAAPPAAQEERGRLERHVIESARDLSRMMRTQFADGESETKITSRLHHAVLALEKYLATHPPDPTAAPLPEAGAGTGEETCTRCHEAPAQVNDGADHMGPVVCTGCWAASPTGQGEK